MPLVHASYGQASKDIPPSRLRVAETQRYLDMNKPKSKTKKKSNNPTQKSGDPIAYLDVHRAAVEGLLALIPSDQVLIVGDNVPFLRDLAQHAGCLTVDYYSDGGGLTGVAAPYRMMPNAEMIAERLRSGQRAIAVLLNKVIHYTFQTPQ